MNVGFHEDRREIGRIGFEVYKVLPMAGWSLSQNDRGRDRVFSTALTHPGFKMQHLLLPNVETTKSLEYEFLFFLRTS